MDPNAALKNIREAVGELRNQDDDGVLDGTSQVGFLLESVEALDEWLTRGGFLPDAWRREDPDPLVVYISREGSEVSDLQELVDGEMDSLPWVAANERNIELRLGREARED